MKPIIQNKGRPGESGAGVFGRKVFALVLVLGAAAPLHAGDAVVKSFLGLVSVRTAATGRWVHARKGLRLSRNDQVRTGKRGAIQLAFANGAHMLVKERSWFSLRRDRRGAFVWFHAGEFLIGLRKKLEGNQRFRVRTPVAVGAIRGTVFWGRHDASNTTTFACLTGTIDVWANGANVELHPGDKTTIRPDSAPAPAEPSHISPDFVQTFAIDGNVQGIDEQLSAETPR